MSEIIIRRRHGQTPAVARASAERLAREFEEEFDLKYAWEKPGEAGADNPGSPPAASETRAVMRFSRPGVSGNLTLAGEEAELCIHLGFFLSAIKPAIEREAHRFFDENFPG
jgi:hypothetical protein